ncbi:MAG: hypothetical protein AAFX99_13520 [Myxococcota bacterium]
MLTRVWVGVWVVAVMMASSATASACVNEMRHRLDRNVHLLSKSERLLDQGKHREALRLVMGSFPHAFGRSKSEPWAERARMVAAVAVVRTRGRYAFRAGAGLVRSKRAQDRNIARAVSMLGALRTRTPQSTVLQARYAEGLALNPRHAQRARKLLEDLAQRDLLTDAYAYAALARLRADQGDEAQSQEAWERCRAMATTPSEICVPLEGSVQHNTNG